MSRVHAARSSSFKDGGKLVEYYEGDEVTNEKHVRLLDSWGALVPAGQEHLTAAERTDMALNPDLAVALEMPSGPTHLEAGLAGGTGDRITGDYSSGEHKVESLQAEVDARTAEGREIEVTGTGSGGNVLRADLEQALADDDAARKG